MDDGTVGGGAMPAVEAEPGEVARLIRELGVRGSRLVAAIETFQRARLEDRPHAFGDVAELVLARCAFIVTMRDCFVSLGLSVGDEGSAR